MDLWIESCERFYDTFKNDFVKRLDAVNELKARCDKVYFMNEFLEESRFISTDKYLEIADRYEKVLDKFSDKYMDSVQDILLNHLEFIDEMRNFAKLFNW